jgi:predicted kinase
MPLEIKTPTVHMICGFIGAGKTTFAKKLEKEIGAVRITKDEWMVQIFGNRPPKDKFAEYDKNVSKLSQEFAFRVLKAGVDVSLDDGFWYKSQRDEVRKAVEALGGKPVLYYVRQPFETMKARTVERSKNPPSDSFEISEDEFEGYVASWQPPAEDEEYELVERN